MLYAIAGEGWERPYLERLAADEGVGHLVQFRGRSADDELTAYYQQCDLFALPNRQVGWDFEGFGIVLLEAQACARPAIVGRSGGAPETVVDGQTGCVVDCGQPETLAAATIALLDDPARRDGWEPRDAVMSSRRWTGACLPVRRPSNS